MVSFVLTKNHFAKVLRVVIKTFLFSNFRDIYVNKEKESHESARAHYENAKIHSGYRDGIFGVLYNI